VESRLGVCVARWHHDRVVDMDASESVARPIRLAVVDDHPAIAAAVATGVAAANATANPAADTQDRQIRIVGTARTPEEGRALLERAGADAPDVALCDLQIRGATDGLGLVEMGRLAGVRMIVLTSFDRSSLMRAAFERGASGFLDKGAEIDDIVRAVRKVAAGGSAFSAASLDAARYGVRQPSEREIAVLSELRRGATSEEIGVRLGISARTVESHLRRLFDRYGVVSRTELAVLSLREGWIDGRA
jgi:DNA-binding NarL/FixJ family response regulator